VISETTGETVYSVRIQGARFLPFVFEPGTYTVEIDGGKAFGKPTKLEGLTPSDEPGVEGRKVQFDTFKF
jgi:hypothetical protein